jgi:2-haloacid dehalogenase
MQRSLAQISTLTFDMFGTVLDLSGSIVPAVRDFLDSAGAEADAAAIWADWRTRQRLEQHQDTILMLGHRGYVDSARRALQHTLQRYGVSYTDASVRDLLGVFERLRPFDDAQAGLLRLGRRYRLVALSNGDRALVEHLATNNVEARFDRSLSVDSVGRFKPHPSVYRMAASELGCEPAEIMMVAAHAFDILGARACGYRGAYVNRYGLPYEESALLPDFEVQDFNELADRLLGR